MDIRSPGPRLIIRPQRDMIMFGVIVWLASGAIFSIMLLFVIFREPVNPVAWFVCSALAGLAGACFLLALETRLTLRTCLKIDESGISQISYSHYFSWSYRWDEITGWSQSLKGDEDDPSITLHLAAGGRKRLGGIRPTFLQSISDEDFSKIRDALLHYVGPPSRRSPMDIRSPGPRLIIRPQRDNIMAVVIGFLALGAIFLIPLPILYAIFIGPLSPVQWFVSSALAGALFLLALETRLTLRKWLKIDESGISQISYSHYFSWSYRWDEITGWSQSLEGEYGDSVSITLHFAAGGRKRSKRIDDILLQLISDEDFSKIRDALLHYLGPPSE